MTTIYILWFYDYLRVSWRTATVDRWKFQVGNLNTTKNDAFCQEKFMADCLYWHDDIAETFVSIETGLRKFYPTMSVWTIYTSDSCPGRGNWGATDKEWIYFHPETAAAPAAPAGYLCNTANMEFDLHYKSSDTCWKIIYVENPTSPATDLQPL